MHLNIEIKARTDNAASIRRLLEGLHADFKGLDHQEDLYFKVPNGRLKLRTGNIEQNLIFYRRPDQAGPKRADVYLYRPHAGPELKEVLTEALGVWKMVKKAREIYFLDNVKFHLDQVEGLGEFVEIEAIDLEGSLGEIYLRQQCDHYLKLFGIKEEDLLEQSYSDMLT